MPVGGGSGPNGKPQRRQAEPMVVAASDHGHPLRAVLADVHAGSCPGELNFHCHTTCSDGSLRPEQLGEEALAVGLRHLAVTDHHSTEAFAPLQNWFAGQAAVGRSVPTLWTGLEISCLLEGCLVHVLALGFEAGHGALAPYRQGCAPVGAELRAAEVCCRVQAAGGLALLAHPARYRLPYQRLITAAAELGFDGAEAFYDYNLQSQWRPTPLVCEAIDSLLINLGLLRSCGTDTHGLHLSGR
jgi:predicted metal-dependent phosphoesterase TrpH